MNELIFLGYILAIVISNTIALRIGKEALIALICVQAVLVNLFVTKEITLFGFTATASDALAVGITLGLNLVQEFFSYQEARKTIWISFFCSVVYVLFTRFQLAYIPSVSDINAPHFEILLSPMPRLVFASLCVYVIVQHIDVYLYRELRQKLSSRFFIVRNYISIAFSQFIDTVLFSFLGLYCINQSFCNLTSILEIIAISYIIKLTALVIAAPVLSFTKKFIPQ